MKKIAFNPAVEALYLKTLNRKNFWAMDYAQASPASLSQSTAAEKAPQEGGCTLDAMQCEVMNEIKKDRLDHVTIKNGVLRKYFRNPIRQSRCRTRLSGCWKKWQPSKQQDMELIGRRFFMMM